MAPPPDDPGADRYARAQSVLEQGQAHLDRWLDGWSALLGDWQSIVSEALETRSYPPDRWLPDALSLSLSAAELVVGCLSPNSDTNTVISGGGGTDPNPDPETDPAPDPALPADIELDTRSEMAGPMVFEPAGGPWTVVGVSDLVGISPGATGEKIPAGNVRVRILGPKIMITLVRLGPPAPVVAPGTYRGSLTLNDASTTPATVRNFSIRAVCFDQLFWMA